MSVQALTWVFEGSEAKGNDRCVLLALANRANWPDDVGVESCWPVMSRIASEANVSERTAQRAVRRLVELGEVEVVELDEGSELPQGAVIKDSRYAPNLYRLVGMARGDTTDTPTADPGVTREDSRGDSADTQTQRENPKGKNQTLGDTSPREADPPDDAHATDNSSSQPDEAGNDRDLLFEALCTELGIDWTNGITKTQRGRINAALKELREINATPDDIRRRCQAYRSTYPDAALTPQALTGNWGQLAVETKKRRAERCQWCDDPLDENHDDQWCEIAKQDHLAWRERNVVTP